MLGQAVDVNDEALVDQAVAMLTALVTSVTDNPAMYLGSVPAKPVNLVVDLDSGVEAEPVFDEDAPTRVAEPIVNAAPAPEPPPVVTNARAVVDESESSRTEPGGRPGEVIIDAEVVEIQASIVETFFADERRTPRRDDDEIL